MKDVSTFSISSPFIIVLILLPFFIYFFIFYFLWIVLSSQHLISYFVSSLSCVALLIFYGIVE